MSTRIRLSYTKVGKVRFTGHRDVAHLWERALRKARVPVAISAGFTPRPRLAFGLALPTGAESMVELLDVILDGDVSAADLAEIATRLSTALPPGMDVIDVWFPEFDAGSLQESVVASTWVMALDGPDIEEAVLRVRGAGEIMLARERKGERVVDDIRPAILELDLADGVRLAAIADIWSVGESITPIEVTLSTSGRGVRPTELVEVLVPGEDPWDHLRRVIRTNQWIERNGQRVDVLADRMARPVVGA